MFKKKMKKPKIKEEGPMDGMFDTWNKQVEGGSKSSKKGKKSKKGKC